MKNLTSEELVERNKTFSGGNLAYIKRRIKEYSLDISPKCEQEEPSGVLL